MATIGGEVIYVKKVFDFIQKAWEWLPKEFKVAIYMSGAIALDQVAKDLTPELITFVPVAYRIIIFNLIEVFIVEMAKRIRAQAQ